MRGKRGETGSDCWPERIIPAHAGQTTSTSRARKPLADHPRTCGANSVIPCTCRRGCGSSPHMRGKHGRVRIKTECFRIIPAHAGQTQAGSIPRYRPADHPRTCGANMVDGLMEVHRLGSSPHMRGKLHRLEMRRHNVRIIPAHAGQTV